MKVKTAYTKGTDITAGKWYEVDEETCIIPYITDDVGFDIGICITLPCEHLDCEGTWETDEDE